MSTDTYMYGVQWIDDGGPNEHYTVFEDFEEPFRKMGLSITILRDGGVKLQNEDCVHYYIVTDSPIPYWGIPNQVRHAEHRYSSTTGLWLYTFSIFESNIDEIYTHDQYIENPLVNLKRRFPSIHPHPLRVGEGNVYFYQSVSIRVTI